MSRKKEKVVFTRQNQAKGGYSELQLMVYRSYDDMRWDMLLEVFECTKL